MLPGTCIARCTLFVLGEYYNGYVGYLLIKLGCVSIHLDFGVVGGLLEKGVV